MNDLVAIGKFGSPYGVKGWIKVISYTTPIEKILEYTPWFIVKDDAKTLIDRKKAKLHGKNLIVQLAHCQDRDIAKTYTNFEIYIDRVQLPNLPNDEYYWIDLIGLAVINLEGIHLGQVESLFDTGSNDVLVVKDAKGKERFIPYLKDVIIKVELQKGQLLVDWDATF